MKPILFNTQMVQAILDGRKTTTRRIIKVNSSLDFIGCSSTGGDFDTATFGKGSYEKLLDAKIMDRIKAPYMPGDILYIRETWCRLWKLDNCERIIEGTDKFYYRADGYNPTPFNCFPDENGFNGERDCPKWRPSIHMPKAAARIFLKVIDVRVERLQDIDCETVQREGIKACEHWLMEWKDLWDSTLKKDQLEQYGFNANPYVWVIEFERCDKPNE